MTDIRIRPFIKELQYDLNTILRFARITRITGNLILCDVLILQDLLLVLFSKNRVFTPEDNNLDLDGLSFSLFALFLLNNLSVETNELTNLIYN